MAALPRASLLAYLRRPAPNSRGSRRTSRYRQRPPPPYSAQSASHPFLPCIPEVDPETLDEEARIGSAIRMKPFATYSSDEDDEDEEREEKRAREQERTGRWMRVFCLVCLMLAVLAGVWCWGVLKKYDEFKTKEVSGPLITSLSERLADADHARTDTFLS